MMPPKMDVDTINTVIADKHVFVAGRGTGAKGFRSYRLLRLARHQDSTWIETSLFLLKTTTNSLVPFHATP